MLAHNRIVDYAASAFSSRPALERLGTWADAHARAETERLGFKHLSSYRFPQLPFWISEDHYMQIERDLRILLNIIPRLGELRFGGNYHRWAEYLGLVPDLIAAMRPFFGRALGPQIARPDGFLTERSVCVCELNIDSGISGFAAAHARFQYYSGHEQLIKILRELGHTQRCLSPLVPWLNLIGAMPKPVWMMIPDTHSTVAAKKFTDIEVDLLQQTGQGIIATPPESANTRADGISIDGKNIRSVYRAMSDQTLFSSRERFGSVLDCLAQNREIVFTAPKTTSLLENKINLALLRDENVRLKLEPRELDVIDRVVPETRKLDHQLAEIVSQDRQTWVLKKANSKSGADICIGNDVSQRKFDAALGDALSETDWVAQRYARSVRLDNLFIVAGALKRIPCPSLAHLFVLEGSLVGMDCEIAVWDQASGAFLNSPGYAEKGDGLIAVLDAAPGAREAPH
jgi:hypothetical protein